MEQGDVLAEVVGWEAQLETLHGGIAHRFSRSESRLRALAYLRGIVGVGGAARMGGSWPNMLETPPPTECNVCWALTSGTRRRSGMTCRVT